MSNNGGSRVSIPNSVRKTIQDIKEITSNHSEEDIYAMLKECSMDPNETTQRLLHLDTFHEVKRKRDKRKENVKSRSIEESRGKPGYQGRGTRGARGNSYFQHTSNDAGGRRNAAIRKENGTEESRERGFRESPAPVAKGSDSIQPLHVAKSSFITMNGPVGVPNVSVSSGHGAQSSGVGDSHLSKENIDATASSSSRTIPKANIDQALSASDTVLVPSHESEIPNAVGAIKHEVQIQQISGEQGPPIPDDKELSTTDSMNNSHLSQQEPQNVDGLEVSSSMIKEEVVGQNVAQPKVLGGCPADEKICARDSNSTAKSSSSQVTGQMEDVEKAASKLQKLKFPHGQHVIIPDHIQVPDAVKNILSFGSLDASFGITENHFSSENNEHSKPAADIACEETACEPPSCGQEVVSTAPEGKNVDHPQSPHEHGKNSPSDAKVSFTATAPKNDKLKEEILPAVGPPFPVVQTTPSYSFGFMPPMLVNPLVQPEAFDSQAPVSISLSGSSPISSSVSTPPSAQAAGAQNSVPLSPQPIALVRQPFPPNYIPYSHYCSPFYLPQTMHHYFGHTAFPPPLPTGNVYLAPAAAAAGMKISPAPYKLGANAGNQVPVGLPSGYAAYSSSQVAISPNAVVTSGNSSSSEDLVPSTLKESNIYSVQQSEGPAVWLLTAGRDTGSFPLNSFMNLPPQGQPVISPQSAPGAFAIYHTLQPMASSAPPGLTLLQQPSQAVAGSTESVGPPSNAYQQQQPQRQQQQMNWNM